MKRSQQTESKDKLSRIHLSGHAVLKRRLVNIAYKICMETSLFQSLTYIVFVSCLKFSRLQVAADLTILNESADINAVLGVLVAKQRKLPICSLDYHLVSEDSG